MSVDLSIVLVNWNACETTGAALASIREQTRGISYEVIVVDNGTTRDASVTELPRRFPWISLIPNARNMGFAIANNQGLAVARGRYLLILNNDTIQTENALGASVAYMDAHKEVGALGILHRNADAARSVQASVFRFPRPAYELSNVVGLDVGRGHAAPLFPDAECDVDWICGSFLLIRRECLDRVGTLDERFFIYDEDIDWCLRAREHGWAVRFWPGASMVHVGASARPFMRDKTFVHFRSRLSYLRKHHSIVPAALYYLIMVARLSGATAWQAAKCVAGRSSVAELHERSQRQRQFALLKPGHTGG